MDASKARTMRATYASGKFTDYTGHYQNKDDFVNQVFGSVDPAEYNVTITDVTEQVDEPIGLNGGDKEEIAAAPAAKPVPPAPAPAPKPAVKSAPKAASGKADKAD